MATEIFDTESNLTLFRIFSSCWISSVFCLFYVVLLFWIFVLYLYNFIFLFVYLSLCYFIFSFIFTFIFIFYLYFLNGGSNLAIVWDYFFRMQPGYKVCKYGNSDLGICLVNTCYQYRRIYSVDSINYGGRQRQTEITQFHKIRKSLFKLYNYTYTLYSKIFKCLLWRYMLHDPPFAHCYGLNSTIVRLGCLWH